MIWCHAYNLPTVSITVQRLLSRKCTMICYFQQTMDRWLPAYRHWQTAAGIERRCTSCRRNAQLWPWTVAAATCPLAMARCGRSSSVQARRHSPLVSPQQGAKVPDNLLCRCLGYRWLSATALSTPSPAGCTALSTNNPRPSGVLCRWTNRLEFASRRA